MLVQYVVLRADLWKDMDWPLGSIVAQACHAATAALWESREEPASQQYCSPAQLGHMHKVIKCIYCPPGENGTCPARRSAVLDTWLCS